MIAREIFGGWLYFDSLSTAGVCLDGVMLNQNFDGEWIISDGRIVQGTYRVKSSNPIISPNILINIYLNFIISFPDVNPFLSEKRAPFINFLSTYVHHFLYKADTINIITSFIENCNDPVILNLYVQYSNTSHSLVISDIRYSPVSYEYHIHKLVPTNNDYY